MSETSKLKLCAAPLNTETVFADEVQPVFHKLESHKKPTNLSVSMSVFRDTLNLTEDQVTKPEAPNSPESKSRGPFISPGTRTETKS